MLQSVRVLTQHSLWRDLPVITHATSATEGEEEQKLSNQQQTPSCSRQLVMYPHTSCIAPCRQLGCTALEAEPALMLQISGEHLAGDDVTLTPPNSDRRCALILSVVEVKLLTEEPRATAVKQKQNRNSSAGETFVARSLKCAFFSAFLNIWVTCTQIKVAGFCGVTLNSTRRSHGESRSPRCLSMTSQGRLQRRVQDVVLVAVAVGVAVVALRAR